MKKNPVVKALGLKIFKPKIVKPKKGKGAAYNRKGKYHD
jgi:stalled ribosome alternative rescue factor ArfA